MVEMYFISLIQRRFSNIFISNSIHLLLIVRWAWLLGNTSSSHWNSPWPPLHAMQPPQTHGQKPS